MSTVNRWWADLPHERFWLVVAPLDQFKDTLVVPEGRSDVASWVSSLPAHLPARDVIFHYDPTVQAITASSRVRAPAEKKEPGWSLAGAFEKDEGSKRSKWVIKLRNREALGAPVPVQEIAHVQWDLFPALRELEDKFGDPLYYPFAMGNPEETHPLPGRVFKLPSVFVDSFAPLSAVARESRPSGRPRPARHTHSWWEALDGFLEDRSRAASRAR